LKSFIHNSLPGRVVFGAGSVAKLPEELERLGVTRALLLSTPGRSASASRIAAGLGARVAGFFDRAQMHTPVEIAEEARRVAAALGADVCVTVGGGSTIGLGKAIALTSGLPVIAVPTTYSGSEMTPIYGLSEGGIKRTGRDARVLPKVVIYDPELLLGLPAANSAASGMNAMAHCIEALYAHDGNPITSIIAEEGIRALAQSLPEVVTDPGNLQARGESLYGAWLAGVSLASAGMALHHKLCHTLGGSFNLPHAETHAIVLPHAVRYNRDAAKEALARAARALGVADVPTGIYDLELKLGLKLALRDLGMKESDLDRAARLATENPYPNPAPLSYAGIRALLDAAFHGRRPS
jgi:maleylacetate reductase